MVNIELRKYEMSDFESVYHGFVDDKVLQFLSMPKYAKDITKDEEMKWLEKTLKAYNRRKPKEINLAIIVDGEFAGGVGFHMADYDQMHCELGYWLCEKFWGKGIMTDVVKRFVDDVFRKYGFKRIEAKVFSPNIGSARVLEKAGFVYEGTKRAAIRKHGIFFDEKIYAMVKEEEK